MRRGIRDMQTRGRRRQNVTSWGKLQPIHTSLSSVNHNVPRLKIFIENFYF